MKILLRDLETSALEPKEGSIPQVFAAMLAEDRGRLEETVVSGSLPAPERMLEAARKIHENSGLLDLCRQSNLSLPELEQRTRPIFTPSKLFRLQMGQAGLMTFSRMWIPFTHQAVVPNEPWMLYICLDLGSASAFAILGSRIRNIFLGRA